MQVPQLSIGQTVWRFDTNRRRYTKPGGDLIWREHWEPLTVTGETSRSYVIGHYHDSARLPKKGEVRADHWAFSEEQIAQQEWIQNERHKIAGRVSVVRDYVMLRAIDDLLNAGGL